MVKVALLVRLEAKSGREDEVAAFLRGGLAIVEEEPATITWYALRLGPSTFGIFDVFPDARTQRGASLRPRRSSLGGEHVQAIQRTHD